MHITIPKAIPFFLSAILLATLPGVSGCGNAQSALPKITIGVLTDFTGVACYAVRQLYDGLTDYFRMVEEKNPIPGVEIEFVTYDTRTDPARIPSGYVWLKGREASVLFAISAADKELLSDRLEEDDIPAFGSQVSPELVGHTWVFGTVPPGNTQTEAILEWITDTWDYSTGKPRIGFLMASYQIGYHYKEGIDAFRQAYPEQLEWIGTEQAPSGSSSWAAELSRLKDSDCIITSLVGPMLASFVREARARGFEGKLVTGFESFPGFWDMVRTAAAPGQLHDCYYAHYLQWDKPGSFVDEMTEYAQKYRPEKAEELLKGTGYTSGWAEGMILADAIRRAVEQAGPENVDGKSIRDALAGTDLTVDAYGNPWRFTQERNFAFGTQIIFKWDLEAEEWESVSDWITPLSLASP